MADRPTSVAKSVEGLHHEESALDRARALRDQFARAQNDNQQQQQKERQTERPPAQGSQMIREDAPGHKPAPSGPMRQGPQRRADLAKLGKEHEREDAKIKAARKAQETYRARQGSYGRDHDHDRDR
jgi:hypothetical protein